MTDTDATQVADSSFNLAMEAARNRFEEVIARLRELGWVNLRVDTLVHPADETASRRERPTVRHSYVAGEWTIILEPDHNWRRDHPDDNLEPPPWESSTVKINYAKDLPEVDQVLAQLGIEVDDGAAAEDAAVV